MYKRIPNSNSCTELNAFKMVLVIRRYSAIEFQQHRESNSMYYSLKWIPMSFFSHYIAQYRGDTSK